MYSTIFQHHWQETKNSSAKKVASYQLSEDRAAMALAWDAPPDAVGADTVTLAKIGRRMGSDESDGSGKNLMATENFPQIRLVKSKEILPKICA